VLAAVWVETGAHGDYGWAVFVQHGHRRCILGGTVYNCPQEEASEGATWETLCAWVNFEPRPGRSKTHDETLLFPVEFTHLMEAVWDHLSKLPMFPFIHGI
jgi:hypothetical protein